jgi:hypothetical protein
MTAPGAIYGHHVAGPALITVAVGGASQLSALGLSTDGVDMAFEYFEREIKGDQMGGQEGPPVDILLLGQMVEATVELVDFSTSVLDSVFGHRSGTYGTPETAGTLLLAGGKFVRLCINAPNNPINIPYAWLTNPSEFNLASVESHIKLTFKGLVGSVGGVLFNNTNT